MDAGALAFLVITWGLIFTLMGWSIPKLLKAGQ